MKKILDQYCFDGSKKFSVKEVPTDSKKDGKIDKEKILAKTAENQEKIFMLQDRLYAESKEALVIVIQARDAAGKDSTIRHIMAGINPQGVNVTSFKQPSKEDLAHDYLWRCHRHMPAKGMIGIFNRSYYEDVLVARVDHLQNGYAMAKRTLDMSEKEFYQKRYKQLRHYEEYMYENSYRFVKIFLNVSKEKQGERFMERIERPEKNWKFSYFDLNVRSQWEQYDEAYEDAINGTATKENPWYVIPADQKWYSRYLISELILKVLEDMNPQYPALPEAELNRLAQAKEVLLEQGIASTLKVKKAKNEEAAEVPEEMPEAEETTAVCEEVTEAEDVTETEEKTENEE